MFHKNNLRSTPKTTNIHRNSSETVEKQPEFCILYILYTVLKP